MITISPWYLPAPARTAQRSSARAPVASSSPYFLGGIYLLFSFKLALLSEILLGNSNLHYRPSSLFDFYESKNEDPQQEQQPRYNPGHGLEVPRDMWLKESSRVDQIESIYNHRINGLRH
ncbi:hypothetical protein CFE70_006618 [Pyrenophora teres f. teres 0-1]